MATVRIAEDEALAADHPDLISFCQANADADKELQIFAVLRLHSLF